MATPLPVDAEPPADDQRRGAFGPGLPAVVVLGDGQLARMLVDAGRRLAVEVVPVPVAADGSCPLPPAASAPPTVVTVENELIAPAALADLEARGSILRPGATALGLVDKARQRHWLADHGLPVPPFAVVERPADVERFGARVGWPLVLKRSRGGYDGRGVAVVERPGELPFPLPDPGGGVLVVEPLLALERELATGVARSADGSMVTYPVVETIQHRGRCHAVLAPAAAATPLAASAMALAGHIARAIELVGIMAVELFVVAGRLLVNELALRPHNSLHYTIEACDTSQFENHLRAVLGWPLGSTRLRSPAAMVNVIGRSGDPRLRLPAALARPEARVHLYAKSPRPGRKLGHVTVLDARSDRALRRAERVAALLEGRERTELGGQL